jgi:hypothetical protein
MLKTDLKKEFDFLYKAKAIPSFVDVPELSYLMIDGQGDPNSSNQFQNTVQTLFSISYTLKFMIKKGPQDIDYGVMPLEGLWWTDNMKEFSTEDKQSWKWTLMILQPDFITKEMVGEAEQALISKKKLTGSEPIRLEKMKEGKAAQILHTGPFSAEGPTIEVLHNFIKENGFTLSGKHREIYLNDFRKAAPEKLKTIIRQPVQ